MRLFIAILLNEAMKKAALDAGRAVGASASYARLTQSSHMHLTLAFLGEQPTGAVADVRAAMDAVKSPVFFIKTDTTGRFSRPDGDIWWLGLERNPALGALQAQLADELARRGFVLEKRAFQPHLTVARQVRLVEGATIGELPPAEMCVRAMHLMLSETQAGALRHTPLHATPLEGDHGI